MVYHVLYKIYTYNVTIYVHSPTLIGHQFLETAICLMPHEAHTNTCPYIYNRYRYYDLYTCLYIYMYIYIHTYIHTYIHRHIIPACFNGITTGPCSNPNMGSTCLVNVSICIFVKCTSISIKYHSRKLFPYSIL
jgi:hypothetical protein